MRLLDSHKARTQVFPVPPSLASLPALREEGAHFLRAKLLRGKGAFGKNCCAQSAHARVVRDVVATSNGIGNYTSSVSRSPRIGYAIDRIPWGYLIFKRHRDACCRGTKEVRSSRSRGTESCPTILRPTRRLAARIESADDRALRSVCTHRVCAPCVYTVLPCAHTANDARDRARREIVRRGCQHPRERPREAERIASRLDSRDSPFVRCARGERNFFVAQKCRVG